MSSSIFGLLFEEEVVEKCASKKIRPKRLHYNQNQDSESHLMAEAGTLNSLSCVRESLAALCLWVKACEYSSTVVYAHISKEVQE